MTFRNLLDWLDPGQVERLFLHILGESDNLGLDTVTLRSN